MNKQIEELALRLRSYLPLGDGSLWSQSSKDIALAADALEAKERENAELRKDRDRIDTIAGEYLTLEAFEMPTGGGDADIGWRVLQNHCGEVKPRVMAEVFKDDFRAAIDKYLTGEKP
jgi:hypothetical protein